MSNVNPGGTPVPALLITTLATIALIVSGTFNQILALAAFFYVVQYTASFLAVIVLRRREPELPRPYHAIGYPGDMVSGIWIAGLPGRQRADRSEEQSDFPWTAGRQLSGVSNCQTGTTTA
jgi:amino acid transporter